MSGLIEIKSLVCREVQVCGDTAHIVTTIRSPLDELDSETFFESYKTVVGNVRRKLGNPNMTLTVQNDVEYFYFIESR